VLFETFFVWRIILRYDNNNP